MHTATTQTWKNMARAHAAHQTAVRNRHNHPVAIRAAQRAVKYMKTANKCNIHRNIDINILKQEFPISLFRFVK
jgi:hypothetical protein